MLIFLDARLAVLATPKTGTTALEGALRARADISFQRGRKHMPARRVLTQVLPFIANTFGVQLETVAVVREPVSQIRSWYTYRTRDALDGTPRSTKHMDFDTFVGAVISDAPPEYACIGTQHRFVSRQGAVAVDHLFDYAQLHLLQAFLRDRLGAPLELGTVNVSPPRAAPLSPGREEELRRARADDFALYSEIQRAGGYLHAPRPKP